MTWLKKSKLKQQPIIKSFQEKEIFYHSKEWKKLRLWYITEHPICERCEKQGISHPAEEIHHVRPFLTGTTDEERWSLLLNPNNLMALCEKCHHEIHNEMNKFTNFGK